MRGIQYKKFSWNTHKKNWKVKRPNVCQFELTFSCGLHCRHCYTDCYNKTEYRERELGTNQVKSLLDKVYNAGAIWLCFTGGDPLTRGDFLELYSYAKDKGFIITIFTNLYSMTEEIACYMKDKTPFVIEVTLNAVTKKTYENISQVQDSYEKAMDGLKMIMERKLPLKIKTQITKYNLEELPEIRKFIIEELGLAFRASFDLHARLNGDLAPCTLRCSASEIFNLDDKNITNCPNESVKESSSWLRSKNISDSISTNEFLFRCAAGGGDGINIDPYGNMFLCNCIREPRVNLLSNDIEDGFEKLLPIARGRRFTTDSECKHCDIREFCRSCPGRVLLEAGDMEAPVQYYCKLAKAMAGEMANKRQL